MSKKKPAGEGPRIKHKAATGEYLTSLPDRVIQHDAATGQRVPAKLDRKPKRPPK